MKLKLAAMVLTEVLFSGTGWYRFRYPEDVTEENAIFEWQSAWYHHALVRH